MSEVQKEQAPIPVLDPRLLYCDSVFINTETNDESIVFCFSSGGAITSQYVFTPKHAKRFKILLDKRIKEYEDKNGVLETQLPDESL